MNDKFMPMLGCELKEKNDIKFPKLVSPKLDGIRCIFHPQMGMISRSLKQIANKQLQEKFAHLIKLSKDENIILDGELYHHNMTFQEITSLVMTKDFLSESRIKKLYKDDSPLIKYYEYKTQGTMAGDYYEWTEFDNPIAYHCFDCIEHYDNGERINNVFINRLDSRNRILENYEHVVCVQNLYSYDLTSLEMYFEQLLEEGYEGLIIREPMSTYKFGRATPKSQDLLKFKPWVTYDAQIIGIVRQQESIALTTKNELGQSVKSHKKEFMIDVDMASAFEVSFGKKRLKVSLAMTHEEREEVWHNPLKYVGKMIEFKGMDVGAKNVPRHPVFLRFREDRD